MSPHMLSARKRSRRSTKIASMGADGTRSANGSSKTVINGNGAHLSPVSPDSVGEGFPYAPTNWPNLGDNWTWRVGKRVASNGHFLDRYLYLPKNLPRGTAGKKNGFASKLSVARYIRDKFPGSDVDAFFASFSWKIPAKQLSTNGNVDPYSQYSEESSESESESDSESDGEGVACKAGNTKCSSLTMQAKDSSLNFMSCDICCSEPRFCPFCSCMLCCTNISLKYGGYSYIRCEAKVDEEYTCGHLAHLKCALKCYMAGTVGGCIGLDAEYYCRRCDARTDLIPHATKLLQTCESVDCPKDLEEILKLGFCLLRNSKKASAGVLLNRIEQALNKIKDGTSLKDIWKLEEVSDTVLSTGVFETEDSPQTPLNTQDSPDAGASAHPILSTYSDHISESQKLDEEVRKVLRALKNSQDYEYRIAEKRLYAQKNNLSRLYEQLDQEKAEMTQRTSKQEPDVLMDTITSRIGQIKNEIMKLKDMAEVAIGFGRTSKSILKEYYDLDVED